MRLGVVISLLGCGAALIIMPQIHYSVVAANEAYVIAHRSDLGAADVGLQALPRAMSWTSIGVGSLMIIAALMAARRLSDRAGAEAHCSSSK